MPKAFVYKTLGQAFRDTKDIRKVPKVAFRTMTSQGRKIKTNIKKRYYSKKTNKSLGTRSKEAREGWEVKIYKPNIVAIENPVAHADHSRVKNIKAKNMKFLAIPVGPALNSDGSPRFKGPMSSGLKFDVASVAGGKKLVLLANRGGTQGDKKVYYVLQKSVKIPARTRGVTPFVKARGYPIRNLMEKDTFAFLGTVGRSVI